MASTVGEDMLPEPDKHADALTATEIKDPSDDPKETNIPPETNESSETNNPSEMDIPTEMDEPSEMIKPSETQAASGVDMLSSVLAQSIAKMNMGETSETSRPEVLSTWTAYPSLLRLIPTSLQEKVEEAACAQSCGRYDDATAIYDTHFPRPEEYLIVVFQKADMYESQSQQEERKILLESAIEKLSAACTKSQRLLLKFMLADTKMRLFGETQLVVELINAVWIYLNVVGLDYISDIDLRLVVIWHQLARFLRAVSNYLEHSEVTIFSKGKGDARDEIEDILQSLLDRSLWRHVGSIMLLQLTVVEAPYVVSVAADVSSIATTLNSFDSPPLRFESVLLRKAVSEKVHQIIPVWSAGERQYLTTTLESLLTTPFAQGCVSWVNFAPNIAWDILLSLLSISSDVPYDQKLERLAKTSSISEATRDYTKADRALAEAIRIATKWWEAVKDTTDEQDVRAKLRDCRRSVLDLHMIETRMGLSSGLNLCDYLSMLFRDGEYELTLKLAEAFRVKSWRFDVPTIQFQLCRTAGIAAQAIGDRSLLGLSDQALYWLDRCPKDGQWIAIHAAVDKQRMATTSKPAYYSDLLDRNLATFNTLYKQEYEDNMDSIDDISQSKPGSLQEEQIQGATGPLAGAASGSLIGLDSSQGNQHRGVSTIGGMLAGAATGSKLERAFKEAAKEVSQVSKDQTPEMVLPDPEQSAQGRHDEHTDVAYAAPGYRSKLLPADVIHRSQTRVAKAPPSKALIEETVKILKIFAPEQDEAFINSYVVSVLRIAFMNVSEPMEEPEMLFEVLLPLTAPSRFLLPLVGYYFGDLDISEQVRPFTDIKGSSSIDSTTTSISLPSLLKSKGFKATIDKQADAILQAKTVPSVEDYFEDPTSYQQQIQDLRSAVTLAIEAKQNYLRKLVSKDKTNDPLSSYAVQSLYWTLKIMLFLIKSNFVQDRLSFLSQSSLQDSFVTLIPLFCKDFIALLCYIDCFGELMSRHKDEPMVKVIHYAFKLAYTEFLAGIRMKTPHNVPLLSPIFVSDLMDFILVLYVHGHSEDEYTNLKQRLVFDHGSQVDSNIKFHSARMTCLSRMLGGEEVFIIEVPGADRPRPPKDATSQTTNIQMDILSSHTTDLDAIEEELDMANTATEASDEAWISMGTTPNRAGPRKPTPNVSIIADIATFDDIWGPVSKVEIEGKTIQYNVRAGSIVRWRVTDDDSLTNDTTGCHFLPYNLLQESSRAIAQYKSRPAAEQTNGESDDDSVSTVVDSDDEDLEFRYLTKETPEELIERAKFAMANPFNPDDILMIGARPERTLFERTECKCKISKFERKYRHDIHDLFSREDAAVLQLSNFGGSFGFQGVGIKADANIKKLHSFFKDRILDQWTNYRNTCKIKNLQVHGAVMVSRCTGNAIRCTILDLFQTWTIRTIVELFKDGGELNYIDDSTWEPFLDGDVQGIIDLWATDVRSHMKDIVSGVLRILSFTGLDMDRKEFNVLWIPSDESCLSRLVRRPSQHTWMKILRDGGEASAFAVLSEDSFHFPSSVCGTKSPTCFETVFVVDPEMPPFEEVGEGCNVVIDDKIYSVKKRDIMYIKAPFYRLLVITTASERHVVFAWDSSVTRKVLEGFGKTSFSGRGHKEIWKEDETGIAAHVVNTEKSHVDTKTDFHLVEKWTRLLYS